MQDMDVLTGLAIAFFFGALFALVPAIYFFVLALSSSNKSKKLEKRTCKVTNWNSWARVFGCACVILDGKEYTTHAYFIGSEAQALVGKEISCCFIDETLFIFEVLD